MEGNGIIGWYERRTKHGNLDILEGVVTLTKGRAHIVLRGHCYVQDLPEASFGSKAEAMMERLARFLR